MKKFHTMNQKSMIKTLKVLDELSIKFPLMTIHQINFYSLAPHYGLNGKDFLSMVSFMDGVRQLKAKDGVNQTQASFFIDVHEVHQLTIKKNESRWVFDVVHGESKHKLSFEHVFDI